MSNSDHSADDEAEFVQLVNNHQNIIRRFIISLLPGAPGVDDVIQNTNAVIWKKRSEFALGTNFRAWALSIARFQSMAHQKQLRRCRWVTLEPDVAELVADDLDDYMEDTAHHEERMDALRCCLASLREKDRDLIVQRYWHRTRLQDFAVVTRRSVSALKVTLFRLRLSLRKCVEGRMHDQNRAPS